MEGADVGFDWHRDEDLGVLRMVLQDEFADDESSRAAAADLADAGGWTGDLVLVDLRRVDVTSVPHYVEFQRRVDLWLARWGMPRRIAILAGTGPRVGIAHMLKGASRDVAGRVEVFDDEYEALAWLVGG